MRLCLAVLCPRVAHPILCICILAGQRVSHQWVFDREKHNGTVVAVKSDETYDIALDEGVLCARIL